MPKLNHFVVLLLLPVLYCVNQPPTSRKAPHKVRLFPGHLNPRFEFVENCENASSLGLRISNVKMAIVGSNTVTVDADFHNKRWFHHVTKSVILIKNCYDKTAATCQLFQTWRFGNESCSLMEMKDQIWSPIYHNIHPPARCPVQPGEYYLRNGSLGMRFLQALPFPLEKYFWRVRTMFYTDTEKYGCFELGCQFLRSLA